MGAMLQGTVKVRLAGGPYDGYGGDRVANDTQEAGFGPSGSFRYRLQGRDEHGVETWLFDGKATRARLDALGLGRQAGEAGIA